MLVPEFVPPLELPPLGGAVVPEPVLPVELPPDEPPLDPFPVGGVVPPDVLLFGGGVVPPEVPLVGGVAVPVVVLSAVEPPELAALLEPQALSAAMQTIEIPGMSKTRSFDAKIIATLSMLS